MTSPPATCSIDGCERRRKRRGYCEMHARRAIRNGDPLTVKRVKSYDGWTCSVEDCEKRPVGNGFCQMHKDLWYKNGDPLIRINGVRGQGTKRSDGYRQLRVHGHPLAGKGGVVLEHRKLLYDRIGPGPHPCHWCATPVDWVRGISARALVVDHIDFDRANNAPENIVPSCNPCNVRRSQRHGHYGPPEKTPTAPPAGCGNLQRTR